MRRTKYRRIRERQVVAYQHINDLYDNDRVLEDAIEALETEGDAVGTDIAAIDQRLIAAEATLTTTTATAASASAAIGPLQARATALEATANNHGPRIGSLEVTAITHANRMATIETKDGTQDGRISSVEMGISAANAKIGTLEALNLGALAGRVATTENAITSHGSTIGGLDGRVSALESSGGGGPAPVGGVRAWALYKYDGSTYDAVVRGGADAARLPMLLTIVGGDTAYATFATQMAGEYGVLVTASGADKTYEPLVAWVPEEFRSQSELGIRFAVVGTGVSKMAANFTLSLLW